MKLIGLSGKAGTGKNFLAQQILAPVGFLECALADELKIRGIVVGVGSYEDLFHRKPPTIRQWMQEEGTERGRDVFGEDCWVNALMARLTRVKETWGCERFVITDVRFPNEVRAIQRRGGWVLRVDAPERAAASPLETEARQHVSETALDDFQDFDGWVYNDPIYAKTVRWQVHMHLLRAGWVDKVPAFEAPLSEKFNLLRQMSGLPCQ